MNKVWLVFTNDYHDHEIIGLFSSKEKRDAVQDAFLTDNVTELYLDEVIPDLAKTPLDAITDLPYKVIVTNNLSSQASRVVVLGLRDRNKFRFVKSEFCCAEFAIDAPSEEAAECIGRYKAKKLQSLDLWGKKAHHSKYHRPHPSMRPDIFWFYIDDITQSISKD